MKELLEIVISYIAGAVLIVLGIAVIGFLFWLDKVRFVF
jgi:hypothetical protein